MSESKYAGAYSKCRIIVIKEKQTLKFNSALTLSHIYEVEITFSLEESHRVANILSSICGFIEINITLKQISKYTTR